MMSPVKVVICGGIYCSVRGGQELIEILESNPSLRKHCDVQFEKCLECCENGKLSPVVQINGQIHTKITPERFIDVIDAQIHQ